MVDFHQSSNGAGDNSFDSNGSSNLATLLVIEPERNVVRSINEIFSSSQLAVISAATAREGLELLSMKRPGAVILSAQLPDQSGLVAYDRIRQIDPRLPVIILTGDATTEVVIEVARRGAFECLVKPVDIRRLKEVVARALELSRIGRVSPAPATTGTEDLHNSYDDRIVGNSLAMQDVYKKIGRIALQDTTVLVFGESGTGKELVARAIYQHSLRKHKPFLAINCAALPETILESELFGHERGAFTGADQRRVGKFEMVSGGTIFLDEIGEMSSATQAKALRLLQEQQFERVGGNTTVKTDVRIIAATNRDLSQDVTDGRFRRDLLYRLNGFTIHLPPLRERPEDIPPLAAHFVKFLNRQLGKEVWTIAPSVLEILQQHPWPGNVRELQSAIHYAMVQATGHVLIPEHLPVTCLPRNQTPATSPLDEPSVFRETAPGRGRDDRVFPFVKLIAYVNQLLADGEPRIYRQILEEVDRHVLSAVMKHFHGRQFHAAKRLGISRMTLRTKLRSFGMIHDDGQIPSQP